MHQLSIFDAPTTEQTSLCLRIPNPLQAVKFRQLAAAMQETIDAKKNPAIAQQRPTKRRLSIIEEIYQEAKQLEQIQSWLYTMADAAEAGELPEILRGISSKSQLEILRKMSFKSWTVEKIQEVFESDEEEYNRWESTLKRANIHNWRQAYIAIAALTQLYSPPKEDPIEVQIRHLETELVGMRLHEFFPTPRHVCDRKRGISTVATRDAGARIFCRQRGYRPSHPSPSPGRSPRCCGNPIQSAKNLGIERIQHYWLRLSYFCEW